MGNLVDEIKKKYGIDISKTNIIKLYGLKDPGISDHDLTQILQKKRDEWDKRTNNPNEKVSGPAKKNLEYAGKYEQILRDHDIRERLWQYYSGNQDPMSSEDIKNAKTFFDLVTQTKKQLTWKDVKFYTAFFQLTGSRKRTVEAMAESDYKVKKTGKENTDNENENDGGEEFHDKKPKKSSLVVNLFQPQTLILIHKGEMLLEKMAENEQVLKKHPSLSRDHSIPAFLSPNEGTTIQSLSQYIRTESENAQHEYTEFGAAFSGLRDFYNIFQDILEAKDVQDNFREFLLLLQYPILTPYMFEFVELKPQTLEQFFNMADEYYSFVGYHEFLLKYFIPLYKHFGIYDRDLQPLLKQVMETGEKGTEQADFRSGVKNFFNLPDGIHTRHIRAYWPVFVLYFIFEIFKNIAEHLRTFSVAAGGLWILHRVVALIARGDFAFIKPVSGFDALLCVFVWAGNALLEPAIMAAIVYLIWQYAGGIHKTVDWIGIERTFHRILHKCRKNANKQSADRAN